MLKVSDLRKAHDVDPLFDRVSFVLNDGDRVGLVGPNGVGKTTLFKMIAGEETADAGSIQTGSDDQIGFLRQEVTNLSITVGDYLRSSLGEVASIERELHELETQMVSGTISEAALTRYGALQDRFTTLDGWMIDDIIARGRKRLDIEDLPLGTTLGDISGGQQARVMMAGVLLREPTILLLDEPTNHLDLDGILWLEEFVDKFSGVVFAVSHDRRFLDRAVSKIFELDGIGTELQTYTGGYTAYKEEKQRRWERRLLDFEAQEKYRQRLEADIERTKQQAFAVESSTRNDQARRLAAKVAKKAKARENILKRQMKMASWVARPETRPKITIHFSAAVPSGSTLLKLTDSHYSYDGHEVLHGVNLELRGRDRVAIVGANGSGKSTLLRLALQKLDERGTVKVGYLPQDHQQFPMKETVLQFFRSQVVMDEDEARTFLDRFLFEQFQMRQRLASLSSGERTRLALAALVCSGAECLLLDEPTNHLDFDSLDVVEEALSDYRGTALIVSHDRQFLRDIGVSHVIALRDGFRDDHWAARLSDELIVAPSTRR
ncbi:MAG TPA: ABC-F family ATP-binding cassette domain-containing protein [Solirubrobacteraceae bacterium]|nr:ABC-F family ATP-binding cassette domain-containing protein [Solirubrobacteraceae bacterium]